MSLRKRSRANADQLGKPLLDMHYPNPRIVNCHLSNLTGPVKTIEPLSSPNGFHSSCDASNDRRAECVEENLRTVEIGMLGRLVVAVNNDAVTRLRSNTEPLDDDAEKIWTIHHYR